MKKAIHESPDLTLHHQRYSEPIFHPAHTATSKASSCRLVHHTLSPWEQPAAWRSTHRVHPWGDRQPYHPAILRLFPARHPSSDRPEVGNQVSTRISHLLFALVAGPSLPENDRKRTGNGRKRPEASRKWAETQPRCALGACCGFSEQWAERYSPLPLSLTRDPGYVCACASCLRHRRGACAAFVARVRRPVRGPPSPAPDAG